MTRRSRDFFWLWGTRIDALRDYGFPPSRMSVGEGLRLLGLDQAMMCGSLPPTEEEYAQVSHCRRLLWEMSFEEGFAFTRPLAPIVRLHRAHSNVVGVLLDDFSTTEIDRGAQPEVLANLRRAMPQSLELWVVVYSMSLEIPNLSDYLEHVDGISFWVWHGSDLPNLQNYVDRCREVSGGKPMILGLYLYNFGERRPMTVEQMEAQLAVARELLLSGECEGICLLASSILDVGLDSVEWTRRWIEQYGDEPIVDIEPQR